ncbi:polysaccharide lyase family 8 super-sandwich domain-containing protein [Paenibacillus qinlingensis]|uniref:Uncharacterized protein YjdB n=1 Tax=Paenibacillus qinlingensis TaxID=1837343 RepID=A0ABU1P0U9_9BACL|nr:polysaccharide lyase family 8 super-sandwich domain-containing protein [Paenibacillus qinlingensis]MDR6553159.1 uncharacterized protein YjdB [Paenibacillus qinlingensis]
MISKVKKCLTVGLALALVSQLFSGLSVPFAHASEQSYTVMNVQDNFVRKTPPSPVNPDYSNLPNGGEASKAGYLNVKETNTTSPREAYLQFDLTNYPEHITSAELFLFGKNSESATNTVTAKVYGVDTPTGDSWSESALTWNSKPGPGGNLIGSMIFPSSTAAGWRSLDVTSFIQSQLTTDKKATFALTGSNALIKIESRTTTIEDTPGHKAKPYLVIHGTPSLKAVSVVADHTSLGLGQSANLTISGTMDTNTPAVLSSATVTYTSDSTHFVIDDATIGVARAVSSGSATITASVTLEGVTRSASVLLTADGIAPAEVSNVSGGLRNGEYALSWSDPGDVDYAGVNIYEGTTLLGTVAKGIGTFQAPHLNAGESYTFTIKTRDLAGNLSSGIPFTFVYEQPNVLKEVVLSPSTDTIKPGQSVVFSISATRKNGETADLTQAAITYVSNSESIALGSGGTNVANAVYAGSARVKAIVTLDGVTRESASVLVRVYPTAQDAYDTLRIKYAKKMSGYDPDNSYDVNDPDIQQIIQTLDADTKNLWESMNKTTYTWLDLTSTTKSVELSTMSSRLRTMAKAWATYGSAYYQEEALLYDMLESWNQFYLLRYNENKSQYDNWFDWLVNVPNNINDSMILLYETIPYSAHPDLITKLNRAIDKFNPTVTRTGANRVFVSKVMILRGITGKQSSRIQAGSDGLTEVFPNVMAGDGFYEDGSFIQHDYFPYAGAYGKALLQDFTDTLWLVSGSEWDNEDSQKANIFDWYFEAFEPNLYKGQMINAIDGREISREYTFGGYAVLNALLTQVELAGNPYVEKQKSAIKYHIENANVRAFLSNANIWNMQKAKSILNDETVEAYTPPAGNFLFYNQDNVVHRGEDWLYSISMHSDRMANYETVSNENLKGWYEADGMTQLYLDPLDYLALFWTTADSSRLPGITVDRDVNRPASTSANRPYVDVSKFAGDGELMETSWTGGVSLDRTYGTAGMDFKQHDYGDMDVSAKKSWFMFDDEIVALGAGINSTSDRPIETIVENRPLNANGDNVLTVDGSVDLSPMGQQVTKEGTHWIHLDGTGGYVFPNVANVEMLREEREGKSKTINEKFFFPGDDEFNSTNRAANWGWIRENQTHNALTGTKLQIKSQQGSLRGNANSTFNLFQTAAPKEDFFVTTSLDIAPTQPGQEAGLLIRKDDDNYVSLSKGMTSQGSRIIAVNEVDGVSQVVDFPLNLTGDVFLKIDKSNDRYSVYASSSETAWGTPLYTFTNAMAGTDRLNMGLKMGLFAQSGTETNTEVTASFDFFHLWHTRNYMTLWMPHGIAPQEADYSYIQLPKKDAAAVAAYSANPDVVVLSNTPEIQAVKDSTLDITGINFWKRGTMDHVKANHSSSVMLKETNEQLALAVSDPTQKQDRISFEIKKQGTEVISKDSTITVLQLSPTIKFEVDTTADPGKTHVITFGYDDAVAVEHFSVPSLASTSFATSLIVVGAGTTAAPALTATLDDQGAAVLSPTSVLFYSSNEQVATVDSAGSVTGISPGTAEITSVVTVGGISKTATLQVLVPSANPTVITKLTSKDTFVRSGMYQEDAYGNDTKLNVKNAGGDDYREAYFSFDLSGIAGEIASVKFHATGKVDDSSGTFVDTVLKPVLSDWEEGTVHYASKPALGKAITEATRYTNVEADKSFDITKYTKERLKTSTTLDLALVEEVLVGRKIYVYASENTNKQPYLEVVVHAFNNAIQNSVVNPTLAVFDKNSNSTEFKDSSVSLSLNGNLLEGISNGSVALAKGTDYTVLGNQITLKKAYLMAQAVGSLSLNFQFSAGTNAMLAVDIMDTTPPSSIDGGDSDEQSEDREEESVGPTKSDTQSASSTPTRTMLRNGNSIYAIAESHKTFSDLVEHWARTDIELLASKQIVHGVTKMNFAPERSMTRAEFVALLIRGLGLPEELKATHFTDITREDWFAGAIGAAVKAGLIDGYVDGTFQPEGTITREQMAVLIVRAMRIVRGTEQAAVTLAQALSRFSDRNAISDWAAAAVDEAVATNILSGVSDTEFEPLAEATRAQATVILKRMLQQLNFIN